MSQPLNKNCPICGGYVYLMHGKQICCACGYIIPGSTQAVKSSGYSNKSTSNDKYCPTCNVKMELFGDKWLTCPNCHYGYMDYIGDPKELDEEELKQAQKLFESNLYIHNDGLAVGKINAEDLLSNTLQFDRCEKIIFKDKTLDFIFEIPDERYKDIDTVICLETMSGKGTECCSKFEEIKYIMDKVNSDRIKVCGLVI